jgi:hypothetical protein
MRRLLQNFSRDVTSKEPHPAALGSGPCLKALFVISHVETSVSDTTMLVGVSVLVGWCRSRVVAVPTGVCQKSVRCYGSLIGAERGNTVLETVCFLSAGLESDL